MRQVVNTCFDGLARQGNERNRKGVMPAEARGRHTRGKDMKSIGCIQVLLGLLAIGSGTIVLHGVLKVKLSGIAWSGFKIQPDCECSRPPASNSHLSPIQGICMLSVYCAGAAVLAWRKFRLAGLWRSVFSLSVVAVLYLNVVSMSIRLFEHSVLFAMASMESRSHFAVAQFYSRRSLPCSECWQ